LLSGTGDTAELSKHRVAAALAAASSIGGEPVAVFGGEVMKFEETTHPSETPALAGIE
jgi:hypothetical protein